VATVLADRAAGTARPQVKEALVAVAGRGPKPLRLAAIAALGAAGDVAALSPLLAIAADPDAIILTDTGALSPDETVALTAWVEDGGALMRRLPLRPVPRQPVRPCQRTIDRVPIMRRHAADHRQVERIDHFMHDGVPRRPA
jgi:hypothetical protein